MRLIFQSQVRLQMPTGAFIYGCLLKLPASTAVGEERACYSQNVAAQGSEYLTQWWRLNASSKPSYWIIWCTNYIIVTLGIRMEYLRLARIANYDRKIKGKTLFVNIISEYTLSPRLSYQNHAHDIMIICRQVWMVNATQSQLSWDHFYLCSNEDEAIVKSRLHWHWDLNRCLS